MSARKYNRGTRGPGRRGRFGGGRTPSAPKSGNGSGCSMVALAPAAITAVMPLVIALAVAR